MSTSKRSVGSSLSSERSTGEEHSEEELLERRLLLDSDPIDFCRFLQESQPNRLQSKKQRRSKQRKDKQMLPAEVSNGDIYACK